MQYKYSQFSLGLIPVFSSASRELIGKLGRFWRKISKMAPALSFAYWANVWRAFWPLKMKTTYRYYKAVYKQTNNRNIQLWTLSWKRCYLNMNANVFCTCIHGLYTILHLTRSNYRPSDRNRTWGPAILIQRSNWATEPSCPALTAHFHQGFQNKPPELRRVPWSLPPVTLFGTWNINSALLPPL